MDRTDEALLAAFARGEREALGALAARYERALLGLAYGLLDGRDELAREAVQETWVRVIRHGASFHGRSSVKTWLYRIAINQCNTVRKQARRRANQRAASDTGDAMAPSVGNGPAETACDDEARQRLRDVMRRLDADKRNVLLICYHEGLTHTEAAATLGIPIGTLKSRLNAALKQLRECLDREAMQ